MQKAKAEDIKREKMLAGEIEDPNFDRRLDIAVAGCQPFVKRNLLSNNNNITRQNARVLPNQAILFIWTRLTRKLPRLHMLLIIL